MTRTGKTIEPGYEPVCNQEPQEPGYKWIAEDKPKDQQGGCEAPWWWVQYKLEEGEK